MRPRRPKARRFRCQATREDKRCKETALLESKYKVGTSSFKIPVKVKLCLRCSREWFQLNSRVAL